MDKPSLKALRELHEKATPGPWFWNSYSTLFAVGPPRPPDDEPNGYQVCYVETLAGDTSTTEGGNNARLIEATRNALPALLAIAEAARDRAAAEFDAMVAHAAGDIALRTQHGKRYAEADTRLTSALALVEE